MSTPTVDVQRAARRNTRQARSRMWQDCARRASVDAVSRTMLRRYVKTFTRGMDTEVPQPPQPHRELYQACLAGREPAESLPTRQRELLVAELCTTGWTDRQIASHTRMTLYTTARIRARLGLSPNNTGEAGT